MRGVKQLAPQSAQGDVPRQAWWATRPFVGSQRIRTSHFLPATHGQVFMVQLQVMMAVCGSGEGTRSAKTDTFEAEVTQRCSLNAAYSLHSQAAPHSVLLLFKNLAKNGDRLVPSLLSAIGPPAASVATYRVI